MLKNNTHIYCRISHVQKLPDNKLGTGTVIFCKTPKDMSEVLGLGRRIVADHLHRDNEVQRLEVQLGVVMHVPKGCLEASK